MTKQNYRIKIKDINKLSEEEFAQARMDGFGASDSGKLLDVHPYGTLEELITEKVTCIGDPSIGKKGAVRMGKELEPLVMDKSEKVLRELLLDEDIHLEKPTDMYGNENHLNVNFDGILRKTSSGMVLAPVEIKVVSAFGRRMKHWQWNKRLGGETGGEISPIMNFPTKFVGLGEASMEDYCRDAAEHYGIPVYYFTQLQAQLDALTADFGYLAVLDSQEWDISIFKVFKHDNICQTLNGIAKTNWAIVEYRRNTSK